MLTADPPQLLQTPGEKITAMKAPNYFFVLIPLQRVRQHLFASLLCLAIFVLVVTMLQANLFMPSSYKQKLQRSYQHFAVKIQTLHRSSDSNEIVQIEEIDLEQDSEQNDDDDGEDGDFVTTTQSVPNLKAAMPQKFEFDEKRMKQIFEERQEQATRTCLKYYNYGPNISFIPYREVSYRFIYVDDVHKILYCAIPKAASTNWKRMFMLLGSNGNKTAANIAMDEVHEGNATWPYIKPLKSYSPVEVAHRIQNFTKIMWVRNPLHRLVSAWRSKFSKNNTFYNEVYGSYIIKKYRPGASEEEIKAGFPVSLKEFFLYLRDEGLVRGDVHWGHYHTHCLSCIIPYDYVGKLEDMSYEATYVLRKITGDHNFQFPLASERKGSAPSMTDSEYMALIKELPLDLLQYVATEFKIDYEMFGYPIPRFFD